MYVCICIWTGLYATYLWSRIGCINNTKQHLLTVYACVNKNDLAVVFNMLVRLIIAFCICWSFLYFPQGILYNSVDWYYRI